MRNCSLQNPKKIEFLKVSLLPHCWMTKKGGGGEAEKNLQSQLLIGKNVENYKSVITHVLVANRKKQWEVTLQGCVK